MFRGVVNRSLRDMDGAFAIVDGLLSAIAKILTIFGGKAPYWMFCWVLNSRLYLFSSYLRSHRLVQYANLTKFDLTKLTINEHTWTYSKFFVCSLSDILSIFTCIILLLYIKFADPQNFSKILLKYLNYLSIQFRNLGVAVFRKHLSVAAFKAVNIHSLCSLISILLAVFRDRILEHFIFIILSLHSVISFMTMFMMVEQVLWALFVLYR